MYRKLMVLYATVGDRNATLRQYERCVVVLERELGVSPLPNTRAIYQLMLDGHVPVISAPDEPFKFQSLRMPSPDFPLVGRESAWQNLEDALISARAGRGNVVFISGEAGIGKSRLMQDFITRYKSDACMFYGAGYSGGRTIPYLPLVEAIRFGRHHFPLTYNLHPIWLAEVSRLLPELRNQFPDLPAPLASDLEDARIRLLTIASYRHDEAEPTAEWRQLMSKSGIVSEIVLTGLDEIAIGNLVRRAFSHLAVNDRQIQLLKYASGDVQLHLLAFMEKVIGLNYSGRYIDVAASAEKGLILADSLGDQSSRLCFLAQLGLARYHMGEPRATLKPLEPARTLSEQEHDLEMRGDVSQFLGHVHFHLGNHAKALDFHLESLECSQELGDQTGLVWCSLNVGFLYLKLGCWDKSKEYLHQGLSLTRQIEFSGAEEFALTLLGQWELYRGNYLTAIDFFQQALPIHQAAHAEHNIAATEEPIGMVYYQLGDLNKAREWFGAHF
jgi:tetratricopeptide (TPR) repeat protein